MEYYSNCCWAYMHDWPDLDICPACKEHCLGETVEAHTEVVSVEKRSAKVMPNQPTTGGDEGMKENLPMKIERVKVVKEDQVIFNNNYRYGKHDHIINELKNLGPDEWLIVKLDRPAKTLNPFISKRKEGKVSCYAQNPERTVWAVRLRTKTPDEIAQQSINEDLNYDQEKQR